MDMQADLWKRLMDRQAEMEGVREKHEPQWREILELFQPDRDDMFSGNGKERVFAGLYDGTTLEAMDAFEGGLFEQLTSPANRWLELTLPDEDLAQYAPVKQALWARTSIVLRSLQPAVSSFYAQVPQWFADTGLVGYGTLYSEEMVGAGRILDTVIPVNEIYFDLDADGRLDTVHRKFKLKGRKAKIKYPELEAGGQTIDDKRDYTVLHCVYRNPLYFPGVPNFAKAWLSTTLCYEVRGFSRQKGYFELPYYIPMWKRRPGRVYPIGAGHRAMFDARYLQKAERAHIVAANFAAEPTWMVHDDSVLTPSDVRPNKLLFGTVNDDGKPLMQRLDRGSDVRLSMEMSEQRRTAIKNAFYFSILAVQGRPQMTATEFTGWQQQSLRQMGPRLASIQEHGLAPMIARRYAMLERAGQFPPLPPELAGNGILIRYTSQLDLLQKASQAQAAASWVNDMMSVAQIAPSAFDVVDTDAYGDVMLDARGANPKLRKDPRDVDALRQSRAKQAAQQAQLEAAESQANTVATVAHAQQAGTLAAGRSQ